MIYLPKHLPAADVLAAEGFNVATYELAEAPTFEARGAVRVALLNIMPQKAQTELDIARVLAQTGLDVVLLLMKIPGQTYKTTPLSHMTAFYTDVDVLCASRIDGFILTGAPLEQLDFSQVRYWRELTEILSWTERACRSSLFICWGAQAALYFFYDIPKYMLEAKKFGIFEQRVLAPESAAMAGLAPAFPMPTSRHTEVREADFSSKPVRIVAAGEESGVGVAVSEDERMTFIVGHLEYEPRTLLREYERDLAKGLPILPPVNYFRDEASREPLFSWGEAATTFYRNFLRSLF